MARYAVPFKTEVCRIFALGVLYKSRLLKSTGIARICILRIITTITYATDGVDNADLRTLLHIGANATVPAAETIDVMSLNDQEEYFTWIERTQELFKSIGNISTPVEKILTIPSQHTMGPLLSTRFIVVLANGGPIQKFVERCFEGQEKSQNIFARAQTRVATCKEVAARLVQNRQLEYARFLYVAAAELAAAIVDFDLVTKHLRTEAMSDIYQQLVACLGNAAELSLRLGQHERALGYAMSAIRASERSPASQLVEESLVKKNIKRKEVAISVLSLS